MDYLYALKLLPAIGSVFGAALALYLYHVVPQFTISLTNTALGNALYKFFNGKWLFDVVINQYIIGGGLRLGYVISKVIDRGVIELFGPFGFSTVLTNAGKSVSNYDTGVITSYALYIILGLISFIFLLFAPLLFSALSSESLDLSTGGMGLILLYVSTLVLLPTVRQKS